MPVALDRGAMLRDFAITLPSGARRLLSDFRGRRLLVLVFAGDSDAATESLLSDLAADPAELDYQEALVVAIGHNHPHGFATAAESPRDFYSAEQAGQPSAAVFITDRYGEICFAARAARNENLPTAAEVFSWLDFINRQCPE